MVTGPARVTLKNVTFRTRSQSDAAIHAERGGIVLLRGAIRINEHLHEKAPDESFAGIVATDHGVVREEMKKNGKIVGSVSARRGAVVSLPDRTVFSK